MAEVSIDEMEALNVEEKPGETKVETKVDDLPDFAKGKTSAELASEIERHRAALRISEDARLALSESIKGRPIEQVPTGPKAMSREELAELMKEDPMAVVDYMAQHLTSNLDQHLTARFQPIVEGNARSVESQMKERYKDEFELFGSQISDVKKQMDPRLLGTEKGWTDLLSYVRGQPENFDKLLERRAKPKSVEARERQIVDSGFTPRETRREAPAIVEDTQGLDTTQLEICRVMNISPKDYKKYA